MNMLVSEISRPAVPKTLRESISPYLLFFFTASFGGWLYEVMFYWTQHFGEFSFVELLLSYRGVLHGPWAPIYGVGAVLMVLLSQKIGKRPGRYFVVCMVVCGVVEYVTAWVLETMFHAKWWDYTGYFLNLNGRICAMSLIFFALAGMAVAYLAAPRFWRGISRIPVSGTALLCVGLTVLFVLALALSLAAPNMGLGVQLCG